MERYRKPPPVGTPTQVAVARHPLHPMLVTFPIAFFMGALATDLAHWQLGDPFWARASTWLLGAGTLMGVLAGAAGTAELLSVSGIRRRAASWSHFVVAVMLLAVEFINWLARIRAPMHTVDAGALYLSGLGAALVVAAGWFGGKLVFEHQVGIHGEEEDEPLDRA